MNSNSPVPFHPGASPRLIALQRPSISSLSSLIAPPSPIVPALPTAPPVNPEKVQYPPPSRKNVIAFLLALVCSGTAGSISLFSMFAPAMQQDTGLKVMEINLIAIAGELGMYVPVPLIGYFGDTYGPACIGILATVLFSPSFYISSVIIKSAQQKMVDGITEALVTPTQFNILLACFACIGAATSSLHFCGVVTAAKVLPQIPGLSISGPIAAFGISCLWQSQIIARCFTDSETGFVNLVPVFNFFTILYLITGVVSYAAGHVGTFLVVDQSSMDAADNQPSIEPRSSMDERRGLLSAGPSHLDLTQANYGSSSSSTYLSIDNGPKNNIPIAPKKERSSLSKFFHDPTVWVLFAAFVIATGPLEMFVNNMGMIINTIPENSKFGLPVGSHVSIFSAFSTLARLSMGLISDLMDPYISRANLFALILMAAAFFQFLMSTGVLTVVGQGKYFFLASASNGFSYGSCFTVTPTIVAAVWGLQNYGTNWGTFILGPSIGATFFGFIFAKVYQSNAASQTDIYNLESAPMYVGRKAAEVTTSISNYLYASSDSPENLQCFGLKCYQTTFITTGFGFVISALLVMGVYRFNWKPKNRLQTHV